MAQSDLKVIPRALVEAIFEDLNEAPTFQKVKRLLALASARLEGDEDPDGPDDPRDTESDDECGTSECAQDKSESVRARKKRLGLDKHISPNDVVLQKYSEFISDRSHSEFNVKHSIARLSQYLGYVQHKYQESDPFYRLASVEASKQFIADMRACGAKDSTLLTYAKTVLQACKTARDRWVLQRDFPRDPVLLKELGLSVVAWEDTQRKLCHKAFIEKSKQVAEGEINAADLSLCYDYLDEQKENLEKNIEFLKEFVKTDKDITRKNKRAIEAYNFVVQFLAMRTLIKRAPRTGVLENVTVREFLAARRSQSKYIVLVAKTKQSEKGPAEVVLDEEEYEEWKIFIKDIRSKLSFSRKNENVFITTGGLPYKHFNVHLNCWMKERGFQNVTTNMLRRAAVTGAATDTTEVQRAISESMHHSLETARKNYRMRTDVAAVNSAKSMEKVHANVRAKRWALNNLPEIASAFPQLPNKNELEAWLGEKLRFHLCLTDANFDAICDEMLSNRK